MFETEKAMISDLNRKILYICPECTDVSMGKITVFDIPLNTPKIICCSNDDCKSPVVTVTSQNDKYKICINCVICDDTHTFTISKKTLWNKDLMILKCQETGIGITFIGKDSRRLKKEYQAQNEVIAGLLSAEELSDPDEFDLLFDIIERINELVQNKAVKCSCGKSDISINMNFDAVTLKCRNCHKSETFNICEEFLDELLASDNFTINK